ncbi:MAG: hypothetical protein AAF998_27650 [Bacteroidota bacterium]
MKRFLSVLSLLALIGLSMGTSDAPLADDALASPPGIIIKGQITKTGTCAEVTTCVGFTRYNRLNLPGS